MQRKGEKEREREKEKCAYRLNVPEMRRRMFSSSLPQDRSKEEMDGENQKEERRRK